MASGSRHEFLLENEDSGTDSCSRCVDVVDVFLSVVCVDGADVDVVIVVIIFTAASSTQGCIYMYALYPVKKSHSFTPHLHA